MKEKGFPTFLLSSEYCNSCEFKKRLHFHQFTNCYPNEENVGDEYDIEDDLFEDCAEESNDENSINVEEKKPNEELRELQSHNLKEKKLPLPRGQSGVARIKRRAAARVRKKLKKNNGDDGVNSITDEVSYCIIYYTLYY